MGDDKGCFIPTRRVCHSRVFISPVRGVSLYRGWVVVIKLNFNKRVMKKEELRIGSYYRSVKFGVPVRCTLADLYDLCAQSDGAYDDPPIEDMFEPIPITDEWVDNMGARDTELTPAANGIVIKSDIDEQWCWVVMSMGMGVVVKPVYYVHELQNLYFAMTGEELTKK